MAKNKHPSQCDEIYAYLKTHPKGITSIEAFEKFKITRLSARIFELKELGFNITSIREHTIGEHGENIHYSRYKLNEG